MTDFSMCSKAPNEPDDHEEEALREIGRFLGSLTEDQQFNDALNTIVEKLRPLLEKPFCYELHIDRQVPWYFWPITIAVIRQPGFDPRMN